MIYLGGKFVLGLLHISIPRFIGSILPSLSRRKQKCLLTERRSIQVPWLPENPSFAPAALGTERERRVAPSTRLDESYHRETVQGGANSALAEFRAVLPVISRKELVPHRRSREGQGQSAPEPRRPWDIELNPLPPRAWAISFLHPHFFGGVPDLHLDNPTVEQERGQKLEQKVCLSFKRYECDKKFTDAREQCRQGGIPSLSRVPPLAVGCGSVHDRFPTSPKC